MTSMPKDCSAASSSRIIRKCLAQRCAHVACRPTCRAPSSSSSVQRQVGGRAVGIEVSPDPLAGPPRRTLEWRTPPQERCRARALEGDSDEGQVQATEERKTGRDDHWPSLMKPAARRRPATTRRHRQGPPVSATLAEEQSTDPSNGVARRQAPRIPGGHRFSDNGDRQRHASARREGTLLRQQGRHRLCEYEERIREHDTTSRGDEGAVVRRSSRPPRCGSAEGPRRSRSATQQQDKRPPAPRTRRSRGPTRACR